MKLRKTLAMALSLSIVCGNSAAAVSYAENELSPTASETGTKHIFSSHTYQRFDTASTWDEAKAYCEKLGGHLLTITSEEEQKFIESILKDDSVKNNYWLGGNLQNKELSWVTGEPVDYNYWNKRQPDNYDNDDCAFIVVKPESAFFEYGWGDINRSASVRSANPAASYYGPENFGFICEWDKITDFTLEFTPVPVTEEKLLGDWIMYKIIDSSTGTEADSSEFANWRCTFKSDGTVWRDLGDGDTDSFEWEIADGEVLTDSNEKLTYDGTYLIISEEEIKYYLQRTDSVSKLVGSGTEAEPYEISTIDDYREFVSMINSGKNKSACAKLMNDISGVTEMVGTLEHEYKGASDWTGNAYSGVFDGCGHTLDVKIAGSSGYEAPFCNLNGAAIRNLRVTGTVSGGMHCSGLAGLMWDNSVNLIENCEVAVTVTTSRSHCGGIVGHAYASETTVRNCLFSGEIKGATTYVGGIYGWCHNGGVHIVENCLENSKFTDCSGVDPIGHSTGVEVTVKNSYKYTDSGTKGSIVGDMTTEELVKALGNGWKVSDSRAVPVVVYTTAPGIALGDVNNDGNINAVDASTVLTYYALVSTNKDGGFNEVQKKAADVDNNNVINAVDASHILSYYAYTSTTKENIVPIKEYIDPPMNGTGGDIETELYKLCGNWETADGKQYLYINNNEFTLSRDGKELYGTLSHTDKDLPNSFAMTDSESGLTNGRYIQRNPNRFGRLIFTEDGVDTEFIFTGDLQPRFLSAETGTITIGGVTYNDPVTVEFTAKANVTNVKVLKLTFVEMKENGDVVYDKNAECIVELPKLEVGKTFTPMVEIPEVIPTYGICYADEHGTVHYFDISRSGKDSSIKLTPFEMIS